LVQHIHLLEQVVVYERALFQTTWHILLPPCSALLAGATTADDHAVGFLAATGATLGTPCWVHGVAATRRLALPTAVGMVDGVHDHAAHRGAFTFPTRAARLSPVNVG